MAVGQHQWYHMAVGQHQWYPFGVGEFTTHVSQDFSGDWDVHWGYDLGFDPWPYRPVPANMFEKDKTSTAQQKMDGRSAREARKKPKNATLPASPNDAASWSSGKLEAESLGAV